MTIDKVTNLLREYQDLFPITVKGMKGVIETLEEIKWVTLAVVLNKKVRKIQNCVAFQNMTNLYKK